MNAPDPVLAETPADRPRRRRVGRAIGVGLLAILLLVAAALVGVDTPAGHRLLVARVSRLHPSSGLRIRIGAIDGSLWRDATLKDVRLYDPKGRFLWAPVIRLRWHPLSWVQNRLDIDRLAAPVLVLDRAPVLRSSGNGALLPGFDLHLGTLALGRLELGRSFVGRPETLRVAGRADIRDGEAVIGMQASAAAGDRLALDLDARPSLDRFRLGGALAGPADGLVAGLLGTRQAIALRVGGRGDWRRWQGQASGRLGGRPVVDLALGAAAGRYRLSGLLRPSLLLQGKGQRLTAPVIRVAGEGALADRQLDGRLALASPALRLTAAGRLDLARSAFGDVRLLAVLLQPRALFPNMTGDDVRLALTLDGPFRTPAFRYLLASPRLAFDGTGFDGVRASGAGRFGALPLMVPIALRATRVTGLGDVAGGILGDLRLQGVLRVDARTLSGSALRLSSDKLKGTLALNLDLNSGAFDIGVAGGLVRYLIPGLGIVDVATKATVTPGPAGQGAIVSGRGTVDMSRFDNVFLRSLAGGNPHIDTGLRRDADGTLHFPDLTLTGPAIRIRGTGLRRKDGSFQFSGAGTQAVYGPFRLELDGMIDHPQVRLRLDRPLPALDLSQVALALDPDPQGFRFRAGGGSTLGPFAATGLIHALPDRPATIDVADLAVSGTHGRGSLRSDPQGFSGRLAFSGGGIGGTLDFAPAGTVQRIDPHLSFANAILAFDTAVSLRTGRLDGQLLLDPAGLGIDLSFAGTGLSRGALFLSRGGAVVRVKGGRGRADLSVAGGGGRTFDVAAGLDLAPDRIAVALKGTVEGRPLALAAPALLTAQGGRWTLARTRLDYAGGSVAIGGRFGDGFQVDLGLDRLPLSLLDVASPDLGLSGYASGSLTYAQPAVGAATGRLDLALRGLSRSGQVLSSQPADIAVAAVLSPTGAAARAVVASGGRTIGRAQAKVGPLVGGLSGLSTAPLFAQARYAGPAETLWRLTGVETLDLSGPLSLGADINGTAANPLIRGSLKAEGVRLESSVSGTVVTGLSATGRFDGGRLLLDRMAGWAGTGTVTGQGTVDLSHLATGVGLDLRLQAQEAALLGRDDISATVTGPLFIRSTGQGGTIGGQVEMNRARFRLGNAAATQVPHLATTLLNRRTEERAAVAPVVPWTLDLHAHARDQLFVTGLGIDSEWKATLDVKGAVDDPAIGGRVDLVRGGYQFAGRRFELARGLIRFGGQAPPDPSLDISADADVSGFSATVHVTGTGLHPEIAFQSTPSLPEDELLSRLLFGTSIANLSAPEALQLASAVASLRSGGGGKGLNLDPINAVRKIVRLDRLRILPADPTTGQKTAVAAGKYIGRRTYVELITDGQGYSATSAEFRITRWLSLLSTISTVGRQSANVKISKDY
jgi:translocation and assembly module TamB